MRRDFVDQATFEKLLSAKGISNDDQVVLYGGNNNWFAAYAYWYFKLYGHENVQAARRRAQEVGARRPRPGQPTCRARQQTSYQAQDAGPLDPRLPRRGRRTRSATRTWSTCAQPGRVRRQDPRAGAPAAGAGAAAGHIPTAINIPWSKAANEDGTFKSDDELRQLYGDAGLDDSKPTIAYCRIGERSCHTWFVLHELLGQQDVKNYDGPGPSTARWSACRSSSAPDREG